MSTTQDIEMIDPESFRDHIATVNKAGERVWIYPKAPKGQYYNWRKIVSYIQFLVLFGLPFIKINGHPAILLNVLERKFIFFGNVFWPQDFYIFCLLLVTTFVFVILFTATFGRLWCGWLCPQTVFLEMLFRRIERWIEGDARQQRKLNKSPSSPSKFRKKALKHTIFYSLSFLISNIFLSYIIGIDALWKIVTAPPSQYMGGLFAMIVFSLVFYGVFSWFREQACIIICPYGRLQSVLQDKNTITISYDFIRGEPRRRGIKRHQKGKEKSSEKNEAVGDCVDCGQCIEVCPTGIDIRNGIQLECVNCTACMDACDTVMEKIDRPKGLIRYSSFNMIQQEKKFHLSPRIIAYIIVFLSLVSLDTWLLSTRKEVHATVSRVPGTLYQKVDKERYSNIYSLQVLNKTFDSKIYAMKLVDSPGELRLSLPQIKIPGENIHKETFLIILSEKDIFAKSTPIKLGIFKGEKLIQTIKTNFLSP